MTKEQNRKTGRTAESSTSASSVHGRTEDRLAAFSGKTVLVLGDILLDEYLMGDASRISPEAPVPVLRIRESHSTLGGAANTAANIASLGGKTILIGIIGEDGAGQEVEAHCRRLEIGFHPMRDGRGTIRKTRVMGQRQQLLRMDIETTDPVGPIAEAAILEHFRSFLQEADIVVLSDYAKGFFTHSLCQTIIAACHDVGKEVVVDPRPEHRAYYVGADFLTPNWKEAQELAGQRPLGDDLAALEIVGRALTAGLSANILMTLGPKGMAYFAKDGESFALPTEAREVYDVSGAGDTVVAMFALARATGCAAAEAAWLANRAAGIVVGKIGTATVTRAEVIGSIEHRLVDRKDLAPLARSLRMLGRRIVTLNGSFDILHAGHLRIISEAKKQGDVLILGLNSDESVRRHKGAGRPVISEQQRAALLLALRDVDYVHIFPEDVPMPFLEEIAPDVHVNGSEYGPECIEAPTVKRKGGRIHIVEKVPGLSTTRILLSAGGTPPSLTP